MGKENDAILSYLGNNERFAELFNCFYFENREVIQPQDISEASEVYVSKAGQKGGQRIRDINLSVSWRGRVGRSPLPERYDGFRSGGSRWSQRGVGKIFCGLSRAPRKCRRHSCLLWF